MDIRELRKSTGMSRAAFAKEFGIPYRTLEDWEAGRRKAPEYVYTMIERIIELTDMRKLDAGD